MASDRDELLSRRFHSPVQAALQLSKPSPAVFALQNPAPALHNPTAAYGIAQGEPGQPPALAGGFRAVWVSGAT